MRLDEKPEPPPEKKRPPFDDRRKYYSHYPSLKHESDVRAASFVCIIIALLGIASVCACILAYLGYINIDWSFIKSNDVVKWVNDNFKILCIAVSILCAVLAVSSIVAAVSGLKQEHYRRGLYAYIVMIISSSWTVIFLIISILLLIRYMRAKGSFFS